MARARIKGCGRAEPIPPREWRTQKRKTAKIVKLDTTLIPFGLNQATGQLQDVADVARGKGCGCICPSCKAPLVARQGDAKEWHFAHISRSVYAQIEKQCEYSFYVSVRMMARQIVGSALTISVPAFTGHVGARLPTGRSISRSFLVTESSVVTITDPEVEAPFMGVPVDVAGEVGGYRFVVYLTHPGRDIPSSLATPDDPRCGIIAVSLDSVAALFNEACAENSTFETKLTKYLAKDLASKRWIYHPRYDSCKDKAQRQLGRELAQYIEGENYKTEAHQVSATQEHTNTGAAIFECAMCHTVWEGESNSASACPKCKTHLFRTAKTP